MRREAFTVVELMIVIGIVGILSTLAIPAFSGYKNRIKETEVHDALHAMYLGAASYFEMDHLSGQGLSAGSRANCGIASASDFEPSYPGSLKELADLEEVGDFLSSTTFLALNYSPSSPVSFVYFPIGTNKCGDELEAEAYANLLYGYGAFYEQSKVRAYRYEIRTEVNGGQLMRSQGVFKEFYLEE